MDVYSKCLSIESKSQIDGMLNGWNTFQLEMTCTPENNWPSITEKATTKIKHIFFNNCCVNAFWQS